MACTYIINNLQIESSTDSRESSTIGTLKESLSRLSEEQLQNLITEVEENTINIQELEELIEDEDLIGNTSLQDLYENQKNGNEYEHLLESFFGRIQSLQKNVNKNNVLIGSFQNNKNMISYYNKTSDMFIININDSLSYSKLNILKSFYDYLIYNDSEIREKLNINSEQSEQLFIQDIFNDPESYPSEINKLESIFGLDSNLIINFKNISNSSEKQKLLYNIETITNKSQLYAKYKSQGNKDNFYDSLQESREIDKDPKDIKGVLSNLSMGDLIYLDIGQVRYDKDGNPESEEDFNNRNIYYPYGKEYIFYKTFSSIKDGKEFFGIQLIDPKTGNLITKTNKDLDLIWFSSESVPDLYNKNKRKYLIKDNNYKYVIKYRKWNPDFQAYDTNISPTSNPETFVKKNYQQTHEHYIKVQKNTSDSKINERAVQFDASVSKLLKEGDIFLQWDSKSKEKSPTIYYIEKNYPDQFIVSYISNENGKKEIKLESIKKSRLHPIEVRFKNSNFEKLPDIKSFLNSKYGGYSKYQIKNQNDRALLTIEPGDVIHWKDSKDNEYYSLVIGTNKSKREQIEIKTISPKSKHVFTLTKGLTESKKQDDESILESYTPGKEHSILEVFSLNDVDIVNINNELSDFEKEYIKKSPNLKSSFADNNQKYTKIQIKEYSNFIYLLQEYIQKTDIVQDKSGNYWSVLSKETGFLNCINSKGEKKFIQMNEIDYLYLHDATKLNLKIGAYNTIHLNQIVVSDIEPETSDRGDKVIALVPKNAFISEYQDHAVYTTEEKYKENVDKKYDNYKQVEPENLHVLNAKFNENSTLYRYRKNGILTLRTKGFKPINARNYPEVIDKLRVGMYARFNFGNRHQNNFKYYRIIDITENGYYLAFSSRTAQKNTISEIEYISKKDFKDKIVSIQANENFNFDKYIEPSNLSKISIDEKTSNMKIFRVIEHIIQEYFGIEVRQLSGKEIQKQFSFDGDNTNGFLTKLGGKPVVIINQDKRNSKGFTLLHEFLHIIIGVQKIKNPSQYYKLLEDYKNLTDVNGNKLSDLQKEELLIEDLTKSDNLKSLKLNGDTGLEIFNSFIKEFFKPANQSGVKFDIKNIRNIKHWFEQLNSEVINNQSISAIYNKYDCMSSINLEYYKKQLGDKLKIECK